MCNHLQEVRQLLNISRFSLVDRHVYHLLPVVMVITQMRTSTQVSKMSVSKLLVSNDV